MNPFMALEEEAEDFEAKDKLSALLRAEEIIKFADDDLRARILDVAEDKSEILDSVRDRLGAPVLEAEVSSPAEDPVADAGTDRFEDFLARLSRSERKEEAKTKELPAARRARIKGVIG